MAKTKFEKLDLQTKDLTAMNIQKIGALFPNVITEYETEQGEITKGIDFDLLQQLLSKELVDGTKEKYQLNWPGKKAALLKANTPITETLRPDIANSKNWDKTENIFIEGDNFTALKILQESYLGKIKMIYIDPPYNTGKDFVYSDKFTIDKSEYAEKIGQYDEEKNKLFKENFKTNPRYHSDWLSMMYERLHIARDLLREDGVIFISIDDNEVHNLRKICDEIFGEENFVSHLFVLNNLKGNYNTDFFANVGEYLLVYSRDKSRFIVKNISVDDEEKEDWSEDEKGFWKKGRNLKATGENAPREKRPTMFFPIYVSREKFTISLEKDEEHNIEVFPITNGKEMCWNWSKEQFKNNKDEVLVFISDNNINIHKKQRPEILDVISKKPKNLFYHPSYSNTVSARRLDDLFRIRVFDYSKSTYFIKHLLEIGTSKQSEDIILDFFAGSSTTSDAVMAQNAEDGGNRKFIMVQLDEQTDEKSEAYRAGYKTIAELSRERIRRAGEKILVENKDKLATRETELDIGFRAFRVDSTNMKDVYYHPKDLKQDNLLDLVDTIKADRQTEDLLIQILLDKGLTLDLPIRTQKFKQNTVYIVGDNDLIVCVDQVLDADIIDDLAKLGADTAVFRDSSFATEADRIKLETHFKRLSPRDTRILVI
jgi:adenine-specific DNA-methyltransferase